MGQPRRGTIRHGDLVRLNWSSDLKTCQLTNETTEVSGDGGPTISADGTRVAFESGANINDTIPEGNIDVYLTTCSGPNASRAIPTLNNIQAICVILCFKERSCGIPLFKGGSSTFALY